MSQVEQIEVEISVEEAKEYIRELKAQRFIRLDCGCVMDLTNMVRFETCVKHYLYGAR